MSSDTKQKRVIALGFFDSVHLGHGALLKRTTQTAARIGARPCALTFDVHPEALITKLPVPLINTPGDRAELIRRLYGIEEVIFAHFDDALMHLPWQDFVEHMLVGEFHACHLVAGYDFHFGYKGRGNPALLADACARLGLGCDIIPQVKQDGITVSSTYIRKLIAQGDVERASVFLGHPYGLSGVVEHGQKLGARLGVPTVNLRLPAALQCPARGVYISTVRLGDRNFPSLTNIGSRPTVTASEDVFVETHILDHKAELYGKRLRLELLRFLRQETRFPSLEALHAQISADLAQTRVFFNR